jgi:hypothetical protein
MENRTNGSKSKDVPERFKAGWLDDLDGRRTLARELRQRYQELTDDLGGSDQLSYQRRTLAERAIFLEYHLSREEQQLAQGEDFDAGRWVQACNALVGLMKTLGLDRKARDVPSLSEYLAKKQAAKEGGSE